MRYNKQPISINDQIAILKGRGLIFSDEQKAQTVLENISYFHLAGYWRTMEQNSSTHLFRTGSRFEDVVARYNFDSKLKTLIFAAIQQIEISVRTRIIHFFSLAHGAFWFLDDAAGQNITNSRVITHSRLVNQDYTMRVWMEYPNASLTAVYRIGGFKEKKTKTVDTSRMGY